LGKFIIPFPLADTSKQRVPITDINSKKQENSSDCTSSGGTGSDLFQPIKQVDSPLFDTPIAYPLEIRWQRPFNLLHPPGKR
jgi:hypothetical protein